MSEHNSCNKILITTPIYYVNDVAHIGHAYTTIIADMLARYSRLVGYDTFFLTGTDEHGQKIAQSAEQRGKTPKEYADEVSGKFKSLWDDFGISYDKFIRTTDESHKKGVQKAFKKMFDKGDIYKGNYEGNYCVGCETFFTDAQLNEDGVGCPDCGRATTVVKEESYFFKLSNYEDKLLELYKNNPDFILPRAKAKEIVNFVSGGLNDLSISRTSFDWGIKLPDNMDDKHIMYVWLDALMNYITALGYGTDEKNMDFWAGKVHIVGKDILRFHAIFWPAF
jgi:methionyl-tRNA synthetase